MQAAFASPVFLYGAGFYAEDETIAWVSGRIPVNGSSGTVTAMTDGTPIVRVEWYDGHDLIGAGLPIVLSGLTRGRHRITAIVSNSCGSARSDELPIDVVIPRRRAARH